jgi:hypothetical protein
MKNLLIISLVVVTLMSCKETDQVEKVVFGTYQLSAIYPDPRDGSGEFNPVESERRITLYKDSTFLANFSFCDGLSIEVNGKSAGTFSSTQLTSTDDCNDSFRFNELSIDFSNSELFIYYLCSEGCTEKYRRINQKVCNHYNSEFLLQPLL